MPDTAFEALEHALFDGRFAHAGAIADGWSSDGVDEPTRRLAAGAFALRGRVRALAAAIDPRLLLDDGDVPANDLLAARVGGAQPYDLLAAGVVAAYAGAAQEAYRLLRAASDSPVDKRRLRSFELGGVERLSHHALLFGDVEIAREAAERGLSLARTCDAPYWRARCAATLARLLAESGDDESAGSIASGEADAAPEALRALFAPVAAYRAANGGGDFDTATWQRAQLLNVALYGDDPEVAMAATGVCVLSHDGPSLSWPERAALRRSMLHAESAALAPDFFTLAARCGDRREATLAARLLQAEALPGLRYVAAHGRLAQAYVELRFGERAAAIDHAVDAARAFDAIGLRRWTDEAMMLLVRRDDEPAVRRRPSAVSLTPREEQVAHLVARGASNREVASALRISEHTVERHVSFILSRLGLRSRWQIAHARGAHDDG